MTRIRFVALPTDVARAYQDGGRDAYGHTPERKTSDGSGLPCRHCLSEIADGEDYLILAHRPFSQLQPYAETGPIFLHARECARHPETTDVPELFLEWPQVMLRGYDTAERIVYGTGTVVVTERLLEKASAILDQPEVARVDLRSARNGCFQCSIVRNDGRWEAPG